MIVAYGVNPTRRVGRRFVRSFEAWSPLWDYCEERHGDITDDIDIDWDDGGTQVFEEGDAAMLAGRLLEDLHDGTVDEYVESRRLLLSATPSFRCPSCGGTGIRTDEVGQDLMLNTLELRLELVLRLGRTHGWCDGCNGYGITQKWERDCRLEKHDIARFADFLDASGGCRIY